jgi:hypothetical protein
MVSVDEFTGWLSKGLGRPAIFLRENDSGPYKEALLFACTHCLTYDAQCEESREDYLMRLVRLSNDPDDFRGGIIRALSAGLDENKEMDFSQILDLACLFAMERDDGIRRAIYDSAARAGYRFCEALVKLDGLDALLFTVGLFPVTLPEDDRWRIGVLINALEDRDGKAAAAVALKQAASEHSVLAKLMKAHDDYGMSSGPRESIPPKDYPELKRMIAKEGRGAVTRRWVERASEEDLALAAADLLTQTSEGNLQAYLRIFWHRTFPLRPQCLIDLASNGPRRVARAAMQALRRITSAEVRAFGLDLIKTSERFSDGVELLARNYETGDFERVDVLLQQPMTDHEAHSLGYAIDHILEVQLYSEAENALLWLYEHGPCSTCRTKFVKHLLALNRLPDWMREEIRYDADSETRKLA